MCLLWTWRERETAGALKAFNSFQELRSTSGVKASGNACGANLQTSAHSWPSSANLVWVYQGLLKIINIISASGLSVLVLGAAKTYRYEVTLQICPHASSTIQLCSVCCNRSFSHPCLCDRLRALKGPRAWWGVQRPQDTVGFLSFCQRRPHGQMQCWTKQWRVKTWKDFVSTVFACCILHTCLILFDHVWTCFCTCL